MFDEILNHVSCSGDVVQALKQQYKATPYLPEYMALSVSEAWTTVDVAGILVKDYNYHRSMAGSFLLNRQTYNIVSSVIMIDSVNETTKLKQFKALSEMLFIEEAKILKAILLHNLSDLYPQITFANIVDSLA